MWYFVYPFLIPLDLMSSVIAILLVNWWAPLFMQADGHLPNWLAWFDTFDADLDTGNRERGWKAGYWGRVKWLNRNHSYGFAYWALGCKFDPSEWRVVKYEPGDRLTFIARSSTAFNVYAIRCGLRFKLGWKAWNMFDQSTGKWKQEPWGPQWRIPFVFSITKA